MPVRTVYVFHTAFCCSTLLSRCLAQPGETFLLIEPLALRDLADAARRGTVEQVTVELVLQLLAKPHRGETAVLIKPSNLVNNLIGPLVNADAESRAIAISSTIEEFLVSFAKKPEETRQKLPWLLKALDHGTGYLERIGIRRIDGLDFWQLAALVWHVQRFQLGQWADCRLRFLPMAQLLARPGETVERCSQYLQIARPQSAHVDAELRRHAKSPQMHYDAARREREAELLRARFSREIENACGWLRQHVEPRVSVLQLKSL